MNVQHSSNPPFQWGAPGCSNGYKEWYAQTPQDSTIHPLRTSNGYFNASDSVTTEHPSLAERSRLRTSDDQHYSVAQWFSLRLARTSFPCSRAPEFGRTLPTPQQRRSALLRAQVFIAAGQSVAFS
jgi:hypothetical protein